MRKMNVPEKIIAGMLALLMCMSLAACGGGEENAENTDGYTYVTEYTKLKNGDTSDVYISNVQLCGNKLYYSSYGKIGENEPAAAEDGDGENADALYGQCIFALDITTQEKTLIYHDGPSDNTDDESNYIDRGFSRFDIAPDGSIWLVQYEYSYNYDENGEYIGEDDAEYSLTKLSPSGENLLTVSLSDCFNDEYSWVDGLETDRNGNAVVGLGSESVAVFDANGEPVCRLDLPNGGSNGMCVGASGEVCVLCWKDNGYSLIPVDTENKQLGGEIPVPENAWRVYSGGNGFEMFATSDASIFGIKTDGSEAEKLFNWLDLDINSDDIQGFFVLDDGTYAALLCEWNNDAYDVQLVKITKQKKTEAAEKTELTLAAVSLSSEIRSEVIKFNRQSSKYRITVIDYSEFNTDGDYTAGMTKLNTEIISGNVPDMIYATSDMPVSTYASKGLIEDLYPFVDADEELGGRGALMEEQLRAIETNGKLCIIPSSFSVFTVIGIPGVVGAENGWTMAEYENVRKAHPDAKMFPEVTRDTMLYWALLFGADRFINRDTGECSFAGDDFIKILDMAKECPAEYSTDYYSDGDYVSDYERMNRGDIIVSLTSFGDFDTFMECKAALGGAVAFKGFPCESRNGSAISFDGGGVCISSKCADKEGAWQFVRTFITEDYQNNSIWWGFPTNRNAFNKKLKEAMTPNMGYNDDGEYGEIPRYVTNWGNGEVNVYAMKQEDADEFMSFMNSVTSTTIYDEKLVQIIQECVAPFFAGQKSAQDVASVIQSRVSTYISEQM